MGRLIEDITFHFGLPPTKLRVWSFVVLPIFYSVSIENCTIKNARHTKIKR